MAATSPAIPVPAAIIWGAQCVIHFLLIWIFKQMFSFFHFLSNFIFPFLSHLFPSLDIQLLIISSYILSIIFAPALRFQANEDSLQCQCDVGLSLTHLSLLWRPLFLLSSISLLWKASKVKSWR